MRSSYLVLTSYSFTTKEFKYVCNVLFQFFFCRYNHSHFRFGKLDVGKYPIIAEKYEILK